MLIVSVTTRMKIRRITLIRMLTGATITAIAAGRETIKWDMDTLDKTSQYNINGPLYTHVYTLPGKYVMGMAMKDSSGCRDTLYRRLYISV